MYTNISLTFTDLVRIVIAIRVFLACLFQVVVVAEMPSLRNLKYAAN